MRVITIQQILAPFRFRSSVPRRHWQLSLRRTQLPFRRVLSHDGSDPNAPPIAASYYSTRSSRVSPRVPRSSPCSLFP